jgi:nitrogen regulatory protein P-II 1
MKKIEATVPPFMLDAVRDVLVGEGADGMSLTEVKVLDPHVHVHSYRGTSYEIPFSPQCRLDIVVEDEQVGRCIDAMRILLADRPTALEVVVMPLTEGIRIRTGSQLSRAA